MKKLMISILLVLGIHQTTQPMFATARAALKARLFSPIMTNVVLPTVGSMVAMHYGLKPLNDLVANPGFRSHNGMESRHWLLQTKDFVYGWLGEIQQGMALASLVAGGASAAYSVAKGSPDAQQQQATGHLGNTVTVPDSNGEMVQITPELRAEQHRKNREFLAKSGYNPLIIRGNQ